MSLLEPTYRWASDRGLLVTLGDEVSTEVQGRVLSALETLRDARIPGLLNLHPAYASILAVFDPRSAEPGRFESDVRQALTHATERTQPQRRLVELPVCYEAEFAPDLEDVARLHELSTHDVVRLHSCAEYVVHFLGFVPGFPYLGGLPEIIATPRLTVPRRRVPAGSVAIGGAQAGIYPFATPGGWRIVGRTPLELFRVDHAPPARLAPGDRVRFAPISVRDFRLLASHGA